MKLITLTQPRFELQMLSACCAPEDRILLRQDAVYLCLQADLSLPVPVLTLASDVNWRQITPLAQVELIDDARWVALSAQAKQNLLWN